MSKLTPSVISGAADFFKSPADILQAALCEATEQAFEHMGKPLHFSNASSSSQLSLYQFLAFFMEWCERLYRLQFRSSLNKEQYLLCKRSLFAAFADIDRNDDGFVSYQDLLDYLVSQRSALARGYGTEASADHVHYVESSRRFFSCVTASRQSASHPHACESDDDDNDNDPNQDLPFSRPYLAKRVRLTHSSSISSSRSQNPKSHKSNESCLCLVASNGRDIKFVDENFRIVGSLSTSAATASPIEAFDVNGAESLVITAHHDRVLRVWSEKDDRGLNQTQWHTVYSHSCESLSTAVCTHERTSNIFTGFSNGQVALWNFSNPVLMEYKKGDRHAASQIFLRDWESGVMHNHAVKCLKTFERVDRLASASLGGSIAVLDVHRFVVSQRSQYHRGILALAVCESFSAFCTGGFDKDLCVWDYTTAMRAPMKLVDVANPHHDVVHTVERIDGASTMIVSCDAESKVKFWDLRMMRCVESISVEKTDSSMCAAASPSLIAAHASASHITSTLELRSKRHAFMIASPWESRDFFVVGRTLSKVVERQELNPHWMSTSPATAIAFESQSGALYTLHNEEKVIHAWSNGVRHGTFPIPLNQNSDGRSDSRPKFVSESIRSMEAFSRGRKFLLGTSLGRLLIVSSEIQGDAVASVTAFERTAVKQVVIGSFEAKPFVTALSVDGELFSWCHPLIPAHTLLPKDVVVTCLALGTSDGSVWLGTSTGALLHVSLPESERSPLLHEPLHQSPVNLMTLVPKLGVICAFRVDHSLVIVNANFDGELLLQRTSVISSPLFLDSVSLPDTSKIGCYDGFLMAADDQGRLSSFRICSHIVSPDAVKRRSSFQVGRTQKLFEQSVTALRALSHWAAFAVTSEDQSGKIVDRHGVVLVSLKQQHDRWPFDKLPQVNNAEYSRRVITRIHAFFDELKRRVTGKKLLADREMNSSFGHQRKSSIFQRRRSRLMSFSHSSPVEHFESFNTIPQAASFVCNSSNRDSDDLGTLNEYSHDNTNPTSRYGPDGNGPSEITQSETAPQSGALTPIQKRPVRPLRPASAVTIASLSRSGALSRSQHRVLASTSSGTLPPTTTSAIPGESSLKRNVIKTSLKEYSGFLTVIASEEVMNPIRSTSVECSFRKALPGAVKRMEQQTALEQRHLPPSALNAPVPRPPSPLESRRQKPRRLTI